MEKARERWRKPWEGGVHGAKVANMAWVGGGHKAFGCKCLKKINHMGPRGGQTNHTATTRNKCTGCFAPTMVPINLDDTLGNSISGRITFIGVKKKYAFKR